jgi:hypothetical protein
MRNRKSMEKTIEKKMSMNINDAYRKKVTLTKKATMAFPALPEVKEHNKMLDKKFKTK